MSSAGSSRSLKFLAPKGIRAVGFGCLNLERGMLLLSRSREIVSAPMAQKGAVGGLLIACEQELRSELNFFENGETKTYET